MSLLRLSFARSLNILIKSPITTQKLNNVCNNTFLKSSFVNSELNKRFISLTSNQCCQEEPEKPEEQEEPVKRSKYSKPGRDRSQELTVETSIEYLASEEYKQTYGDNVVWHGYRRVHKGGIAPKKTRESCIRFKVVTTSSPCPICRDEYLLLDHRNLELLKQFISPHTGEVSRFFRRFTLFF